MQLEELTLPTNIIGPLAGGVAIAGAVAAVTKMIDLTSDWALELDSLQDIMGGTAEQAAALNYVLRKSGTDTEALTKGMTILSKGLVKANGDLDTVGKGLQSWGINVLDVNGQLKDSNALLGEVSNKYNELGTQQERVNFLTEVFGRSGAELIDFFDTLAAEGGIGAVTRRVQELGLAMDPARYEQFNRNLEELKMVGLGIAAAFTEKLMPILETFLDWVIEVSPKVTKFADEVLKTFASGDFSKVDTFIADIIQTMTFKVNAWISGGGPEELSNKIVSWIEDIGTGSDISSKALTAAGNLLAALARAVQEIDWAAISEAVDSKVAEGLSTIDWEGAGDTLGSKIEELFTTKLEERVDLGDRWALNLILPGVNALITFFQESEAASAFGQAIVDFFEGAIGIENIAAFDRMAVAIDQKVFGWGDIIRARLDSIKNIFSSGGAQWLTLLVQGMTLNLPGVISTLSTMETQLDDKLRTVAKTFFNRALGWTQQARAGFMSGLGGLLSVIDEIVGEINAKLKKIITSFTISIKLPSFLGGSGDDSLGVETDTTVGSTGGGNKPPKALAESAERGGIRISNWGDFDYSRLAGELVKALNNA